MTSAVQTIRLEHFKICSVLACLRSLVDEIGEGRRRPDSRRLADIVDYMEKFPQVFDHPKEEDCLFKALRRRKPEAGALLDLIQAELLRGVELLERLRRAIDSDETDPARFEAFRQAVRDGIAFERRHMAREERELLPLALNSLHGGDRREIDAALVENADPLLGRVRRKEFERLYQRILEPAPALTGFAVRKSAPC